MTIAEFPDSLYYIGEKAFSNCFGLTDIIFPNNFKYIGDEAFVGCVNLQTVVIPQSVYYIGTDAFQVYGTDTKYNYELFALSEVGATLYDGTTSVIYIRTDNPNPDSFYIATDMPNSSVNGNYADINIRI